MVASLLHFPLLNCFTSHYMKHGFLLIDKPEGPTSHDAVATVRNLLHERKIGHLGTLDPAASGLLVLAVGAKALKVVEFFKDLSKEYIAEIAFGSVSTTYDREGVIEKYPPKAGWVPLDQVEVVNIIRDHFLGDIEQVPPEHSAIKIGGDRAYRKARQGRGVNMPARRVHIEDCGIISYDYPTLTLHVSCGSGTYIRSLANDLGQRMRCGGYLAGLQRTKVGEWSLDFAVPPDAVEWSQVIPLKEVLIGFSSIELSAEEAERVQHGQDIEQEVKPDTIGWFDELPIAVLTPAKDGSQMAHARKVL